MLTEVEIVGKKNTVSTVKLSIVPSLQNYAFILSFRDSFQVLAAQGIAYLPKN